MSEPPWAALKLMDISDKERLEAPRSKKSSPAALAKKEEELEKKRRDKRFNLQLLSYLAVDKKAHKKAAGDPGWVDDLTRKSSRNNGDNKPATRNKESSSAGKVSRK